MSKTSLSEQKMFDIVVNHLRSMTGRSMGDLGLCAYRGRNGTKCAVGILITDEEYRPQMDHAGASIETVCSHFAHMRDKFTKDQLKLVGALQGIHDLSCNWANGQFIGEEELRKLADKETLLYRAPKKEKVNASIAQD